ncbi:MAG TPA: PhzF family phenazine biosynthesis isomerase [Ornithinimicrobium sp.]|uniref:PhzF family phenazine biosynthesis protein n=1 Tax=Ornithinimicrobium sp. TaxID=1977084 RepID=UPI002B4908E4|nr:PhzF family phenazine biosynthesis isomerase [Ornithinimicrobium sp.]HKJ10864.1 PhzF family phenazine biosynthesis isomerase [Ornithinimicrobium sp.]
MGTEILRYAAFTDRGHGGNPAGVVLDARDLGEAQMQRIAAEVGYSETAFVRPGDTPGRFAVRYFSPRAEVEFCGHATVATAVAMAERGEPGAVLFETPVGEVPVRTRRDEAGELVGTLTSAPTHTRPVDPEVLDAALTALRWSGDDLGTDFPAHVGFAGNEHLLLAAGSRERLARLDYDFDALGALMQAEGWTTVHLFWRESPTVFHARDPFPPGGVVEDPATGAAAAAFGGYLRALALVDGEPEVTVHQGVDMGRPSLLQVDLSTPHGRIAVTGAANVIR